MYSNMEALKESCLGCRKCGLAATRTNLVFGVGNAEAEVLFIGEGPGEQEDLKGEPFVGRGGKLLDQFLAVVDLDRHKNIYIANMVKCRPPQNRDPSPQEQESCALWLDEQIRLINPKIMVCLGRIAAMHWIHPKFMVTKQHGQFVEQDGRWLMGTFHPASLLRNPLQKPDALSDFVALREKIQAICTHTYTNQT